jgi:predicted permease
MHHALLLFPDFATIIIGLLLHRFMKFGPKFWKGLERLGYFVLFPALLFAALVKTKIDFVATAPLLITGVVILIVGIVSAFAVRPMLRISPLSFASRFQCAFRFNSYIGIAVAGKLYGEAGIAVMGILIGCMIPLGNIAAVAMLARYGKTSLWKELLTNPLIIATAAGILWNIYGPPVPIYVQDLFTRLSQAAVSIGLLAVGAALQWTFKAEGLVSEACFLAIKLLILPLAAWLVGPLLGLHGKSLHIAVIFAALPTAPTAYILAARMGGDKAGVAALITAGTLLAAITIPMWITIIK